MEAAWFGAPCGVDILGVERYLETGVLRTWDCSSGDCPTECRSGHLGREWAPAVADAGSNWAESHSQELLLPYSHVFEVLTSLRQDLRQTMT